MNLLKNNNRKFIQILSANCLKANKGRNKIAVLAIVLTAVLFMALTTVLEGVEMTEKNQRLRQVGTKLMVSVKNLTDEEAQRFASAPEFTVAAIERYVATVNNPQLSHMQAIAGWVDETSAEYSFMELEEGHYPQAEDEIAVDTEVLRLLGLPEQTGVTFTLQYTAGTTALEKQMTVCGFFPGMKYEQSTSLLVSESFADQAAAYYDGIYASVRHANYDVRGSFADETNVAQQLDRLVERMGYDPDAERGEDGFIIRHVNPVYEKPAGNSADSYAVAGIGVLLILLAGYLIIYNIFKISIEKDIRLYGQLKTVGASPKQIRYMIVRQGMLLSAAGIPLGLVLGCLLGNALLPLVMASSSFQDTAWILPSIWVWALSGIFTFLTVRVSCARPGRIAGKISPVEALKYHGYSAGGSSGLKIIEGVMDYEKLCSGNYVLMAGFLGDRGDYSYESQEFHAGDVIELEIDGTAKEYIVLAIAGLANSQCMSYSKGGYESAVFAEPVFLERFPDMDTPIHCLFNAKEGAFDSLNEQAADLAARNGLAVLTRLTAEEEFKEMQQTYSISGIIVAVILGVIGILNLVNVIFTGVIARQREFASMRSIGMTRKQLRKLIVYEGMMYALFAGAAGILCSGVLSVSLVKTLARDMWFMKYHFTVLPAAAASAACIVLAACISAGTDRMWNRGSMVEQLRDAQ